MIWRIFIQKLISNPQTQSAIPKARNLEKTKTTLNAMDKVAKANSDAPYHWFIADSSWIDFQELQTF